MNRVITKSLANEIVSRAMAIIHHNVNVIDHHGRIIASGDRQRIGEQHEVAREVIRTSKRICIHNAAEAAPFKNVNPGINHPILVDEQVVMVIGVSGDPTAISRYAELAILTAELLVRQALEMRDMNWRQHLRNTLFCQYLEHGEAREGQEALRRLGEMGFALRLPLVPIVIALEVAQHRLSDILGTLLREFSRLTAVHEVILLSSHEILILVSVKAPQETLLERIGFILSSQISHYHIGVGVNADDTHAIREAVRFARSVIEVGSQVEPRRQVYYFREMAMLCLFQVLENSYMVNFFKNNVHLLLAHDSGEMLLDTLDCFITNNGEVGKSSQQLGIHRNTLTYRLQQIKKLTQLDPTVFTDLVQLSVSVHCYRRTHPRQSPWIDTLS
ncbi:sugar diacid utilization regulator [Jejubacter calystegiae]|uniref:Sugar diacid utilization regulator n=1 Tax=Jejubacter calystegiae TaxID=2579935 RepID=A0A4P8YHP6_9ENTR|nr:sugar diacid recognition domain-containing protein [Jejubacter calystegiae]QCT19094.1 sugar diacid utilization regulator [Jejubacter calystegiae]